MMTPAVTRTSLIALVIAISGCLTEDELVEDPSESVGVAERIRSEEAMLEVVNQGVPTLKEFLYEKNPPPPSPIAVVGLKKDVGDNVIAFRVGPDGIAGTADDRLFATVTE